MKVPSNVRSETLDIQCGPKFHWAFDYRYFVFFLKLLPTNKVFHNLLTTSEGSDSFY